MLIFNKIIDSIENIENISLQFCKKNPYDNSFELIATIHLELEFIRKSIKAHIQEELDRIEKFKENIARMTDE